MKKISMLLGVALVAAVLGVACGSKSKAADDTLPSNTGGTDVVDGTGGDAYGGGIYGGGAYGEGGGDW